MTQIPTVPSKVFERALKFMAMADAARGASETEVALAAEKLQELLQDYGLTMAEIEQAGGTTGPDGRRDVRISDRRALYLWQRRLMAKLAENNFCLHRVTEVDALDGRKQRASRRHQLVGRRINVDVTLATYDYLAVAVKRAATDAGYDHATQERDHHRFLDGAISRLEDRLDDQRRRREAEERARDDARPAASGSGRELVLSDVYGGEADLNNDALNGFPAGTTAAKRREAEARSQRIDARHQELQDQGVEWAEAWYLANGHGAEDSRIYADSYNRRRVSRGSRRSGGRARASGRFRMGSAREYERVNSAAYQSGRAAGNAIGLDAQIDGGSGRRIGK